MDMPPSRYKVVEEGRRLVVVDRLTGERVRQHVHEMPDKLELPPARVIEGAPDPSPRPRLAGTGTVFTTQSWYDDKAPRALVMSDTGFTTLLVAGVVLFALGLLAFTFLGFFALFVAGFLTLQKGSRAALRRGVTAWLDTLDQA
jgi:hypothetical protein